VASAIHRPGRKLEVLTGAGWRFRFFNAPARRAYELDLTYPAFNTHHQAFELRSEPLSAGHSISAATVKRNPRSASTDLLHQTAPPIR